MKRKKAMRKIPTRLFAMQNEVTVKPFDLINLRPALDGSLLKFIFCWEKQQATCSGKYIYTA